MGNSVVRVKPGVQFTVIAPGGFVILAALNYTAGQCHHDIIITSACDGEHSGPDDPHHKGEAYDARTHDLPDKHLALSMIQHYLGPAFYAFLEDEGTENEHIHAQVAKGTAYPPLRIESSDTLETT